MYFLIPFLVVVVLQLLHRKLLIQVFPDKYRRWILWTLLVIHLPFLVYMGYRLTGNTVGSFGSVLRPMARGAMYFQFFTLVNLVCWGLALGVWRFRRWLGHTFDQVPQDPSRRAFLRKTAAGGVGILVAMGTVGAEQAYGDPEITRTDLWFSDLPPGLEGVRIVHLTDLHSGPLIGEGLLRRWRLLAERERPDLLILTGDLVDSLPEEIDPIAETFRDFPAPLGRFAILGNHDYFTDPRPIWDGLERIGFTLLENRHVVVERGGSEMVVLGLQDPMARNGRFLNLRFGPGPMPQDVLARLPKDPWRLCLCHRPSNWDLARETGAQLTLSGHTHGGQINLIPGVSTAKILGPFTSGLYRYQAQTLYVSRGLGVVGLPVRIGATPEIAVITLHRKEIPSMLPAEALIE